MVRLQRLNPNPSNVILLKLEGNNPAGSVKDRCYSLMQEKFRLDKMSCFSNDMIAILKARTSRS